jgi:two-component sensor histidine kinase
VIPVSISASFYRDQEGNIEASVINLRDITDRKHAEKTLHKHAETQEVLLREVNHRVKNNLSAIIGMLYKEQDRAEEYGLTPYSDVLGDLVGRVEGLSTVHSLLSASGWQPLLLTELCEQVVNSALHVIPLDKKYSLDVKASPLRVSSDQAHHLTLVINELTTNTIKHALNGNDGIQIGVDFIRDGKMVQIVFRDDGPGYPQDMIEKDFSRASIGFDLILGIVTESLRGNVRLDNDHGAVTTVTFKIEEVEE